MVPNSVFCADMQLSTTRTNKQTAGECLLWRSHAVGRLRGEPDVIRPADRAAGPRLQAARWYVVRADHRTDFSTSYIRPRYRLQSVLRQSSG